LGKKAQLGVGIKQKGALAREKRQPTYSGKEGGHQGSNKVGKEEGESGGGRKIL